jgi:hypothetical protein
LICWDAVGAVLWWLLAGFQMRRLGPYLPKSVTSICSRSSLVKGASFFRMGYVISLNSTFVHGF